MRLRRSHAAHMNECHFYERIWYVAHMNEACHTCEWVVAHMNASHLIYNKDKRQDSHISKMHDSFWVAFFVSFIGLFLQKRPMQNIVSFIGLFLQKRPMITHIKNATQKESRRTYESVSSLWMDVLCLTYECVTSQYAWVMSHTWRNLILYITKIRDTTHKD